MMVGMDWPDMPKIPGQREETEEEVKYARGMLRMWCVAFIIMAVLWAGNTWVMARRW